MSEQKLPVVPKFRVWLPDPDVERMLRVKALVFENDKTRCMCGYAYDFYLEDEDATIMQSTGLLDRNRKEIFEGDIVARNGEETLSIVRKGILYSILGFYIETERNGTKIFEHINPHVPFVYTIVGNIYENPDLLKEK